MTSFPIRNPEEDELLTPKNSLLTIIDYQPTQVNSINSMSRDELIRNICSVAAIAKAYNIPVILSTVNVGNGRNHDTIPVLKEILGDVPTFDRTTINAWEDKEYYEAIQKTGRKKIIMAALWTEACLTFPTIDAIKEGFEVYPVIDSIGGTSLKAHEAGLRRVEQAGAKPTSIPQLACELQRDWNRKETVPNFMKIMMDAGVFLHLK